MFPITPIWPILLIVVLLLLAFLWRARRRNQALLAAVEVVVLQDVVSVHLGNKRDVAVYLSPGYADQPERRYPVLYVNDGQDMAALRLHETLAQLLGRRVIRPLLVVTIPTNEQRLQEYGTAVAPNAQGFGRLADAYSRFVVEEVMPLVNGRFRTLTAPHDTAILGASLGGLSAFDIAWNQRVVFGMVGVFSGSFWWRAGSDYQPPTPECPFPRPDKLIVQEIVHCAEFWPGFRAWFQTGTRDEVSDRDHNGVIDAIQDTLELIAVLEEKGYHLGRDLAYVEVLGGRHDYDTWSKLLPDFLIWAFGR